MSAVEPAGTSMNVARMPVSWAGVTEKRLIWASLPRSHSTFPPIEVPVTSLLTTSAVPFAATTKMDGCAAIYPAVAALFVAQYYNVPLHASDYLLVVLVSVIGSAATAGLTGALVMLTLTLSTLGLPLEGAGLLLAVYPILDMGRTALNVAGQALVPTIVAKREGILDVEAYHAPRGRDVVVDDARPAEDRTPQPAGV